MGLSGVKAILASMGNPHKGLKIIHVSGTNGKGSTCSFLQHILIAAGFKVGTFTSPHLKQYNERISINGIPISDANFARLMTQVSQISKDAQLSFFEILTCMAYLFFAQQKVDVAIIETGIGGRLDATNVIDEALLSVITAPGYDHQEILGETLAEIALEDAGIIKNNCPVAVYPTPVICDIQKIALAKNAPLYYTGEDVEIKNISFSLNNTTFCVRTAYFYYQSLSIQLLGKHQVKNAVHALLCVEALRKNHKLAINEDAVRNGLANCKWQARFEIVSHNPYIVIDGAHNVDGARIFNEALKLYFSHKKIVLVVGISNNKDYKSILQNMMADTNGIIDTVICTCTSFRSIPAQILADCVKKDIMEVDTGKVIVEEDCRLAVKRAIKVAKTDGVTAVAGSLYLVGECL